ncbi:MAG: hypothetical protein ACK4RW_10420 [Rehaibacterium terrae]|uniref:hypothetical protein n=1 Tax=Rehaibacterium terrae TaxID=1341696 RepID=UPI00391CBCA2
MKKSFLIAALGAACLPATALHAAGGHHAVDDAALLAPGQCHVESWYARGGGERRLHVAPACRRGPVEWALALERGFGDGDTLGLQAKGLFTAEAAPLALGWSLGVERGHDGPREEALRLNLPATLALGERLAAHLNLGRRWQRHGRGAWTAGAALEAELGGGFSAVAERWREGRGQHARQVGLRWTTPGDGLDLDLGRAHGHGDDGWRGWTLGATWRFGG